MPDKDPPMDEPWKPRDPQRAMYEAAASFSASADRLAKSVERLDARLSSGLPQPTISALIVVVGLSALVGSVTALAWQHSGPARVEAQARP